MVKQNYVLWFLENIVDFDFVTRDQSTNTHDSLHDYQVLTPPPEGHVLIDIPYVTVFLISVQ